MRDSLPLDTLVEKQENNQQYRLGVDVFCS
jgi:hypothetical protein